MDTHFTENEKLTNSKQVSNFTCNQEKDKMIFCIQNIGNNFKAWQIIVLKYIGALKYSWEDNVSNTLWE